MIVADESVDFGIVKLLRAESINVLAIAEEHSGITDFKVLEFAVKRNALLITEDKDFGELAFRLKYKHKGILLIRLSDIPRKERIKTVQEIILEHAEKLKGNFSVLNSQGLRIKAGNTSTNQDEQY